MNDQPLPPDPSFPPATPPPMPPRPEPNRHGCLIAWLIWVVIVSAVTVACAPYVLSKLTKATTDTARYGYIISFIADAFQIVFAVALFNWRKWGFYGLLATGLINTGTLYLVSGSLTQSLPGLVAIAFLLLVVNLGDDDEKAWKHLK